MLIDEFLCKREVLGKRAPHSFTPPLSVVGVSNNYQTLYYSSTAHAPNMVLRIMTVCILVLNNYLQDFGTSILVLDFHLDI